VSTKTSTGADLIDPMLRNEMATGLYMSMLAAALAAGHSVETSTDFVPDLRMQVKSGHPQIVRMVMNQGHGGQVTDIDLNLAAALQMWGAITRCGECLMVRDRTIIRGKSDDGAGITWMWFRMNTSIPALICGASSDLDRLISRQAARVSNVTTAPTNTVMLPAGDLTLTLDDRLLCGETPVAVDVAPEWADVLQCAPRMLAAIQKALHHGDFDRLDFLRAITPETP